MLDRGSFFQGCTECGGNSIVRAIVAGGVWHSRSCGIRPCVVPALPSGAPAESASAGASGGRAVSFRNEVVPVLTKLGCNQGACHGGQHGKGGFKLSLLGFEPDVDFTAIVKSARSGGSRRSPRGEPALAQADARGGAWRRQEDGGRFAARTGC